MTTRIDLYDEAKALCRLADDGCPHDGGADKNGGSRLARYIRALKRANRRLRRLARKFKDLAGTDPLTTLANRRAIEEHAAVEVQRRDRYNGPITLGLIDVDHFKEINDEHSHVAGDHTLREVARALNASLRKGVDRVGRYGGDEFLGIAPQTDTAGAAALAERVRAEIAAAVICYAGRAIRPTVSIGFAVAGEGVTADYTQLLHVVASALREAKKNGRNCYVIRNL